MIKASELKNDYLPCPEYEDSINPDYVNPIDINYLEALIRETNEEDSFLAIIGKLPSEYIKILKNAEYKVYRVCSRNEYHATEDDKLTKGNKFGNSYPQEKLNNKIRVEDQYFTYIIWDGEIEDYTNKHWDTVQQI